MDKTAQFGLPLVMPAQAQKHVTLNEALVRLDALAQIRVRSRELKSAPHEASTGDSYILSSDPDGEWAGRSNQIATFVNGGWVFSAPHIGWRAWVEAEQCACTFDGVRWLEDVLSFAPGGSASVWRTLEFDHIITPGATNVTSAELPSNGLVVGVTGRVTVDLDGPGMGTWQLGVAGSADRYGSGLGVQRNSFVHGMTGTPIVYYEDTPLRLSAGSGEFGSGAVRLAIHLVQLLPPREV